MTDLKGDLERDRQELAEALGQALEETIRTSWLPNSIAWLATVVGAFAINLLLLVLLIGAG